MKRIVFAPLLIPVDEQVHTLNFQRIVSTLTYLYHSNNHEDHIFFHFECINVDDDDNNTKKKKKKTVLKQFMLIEYIAQYYSEILSCPRNMTPKSSVIVLPFPESMTTTTTTTTTTNNYKSHFSSYITYQMNRLSMNQLNQIDHVLFLQFAPSSETATILPSNIATSVSNSVKLEPENVQWKQFYPYHLPEAAQSGLYGKYKVVCLGGTFDRLHIGHQLMLTCLAMILDTDDQDARFVIGLSGDPLLKNKELKELIQPYSIRKENMIHMLKTVHPGVFLHESSSNNNMFQISELTDPYGPSTSVAEIEALVISEETRKGGESVNRIRVEKGMKPSDLICIPVVQARNNSEKLSSTQLRRDENLSA